MRRINLQAGLCLAVSLAAAQAQPANRSNSDAALDQFSENVQALAARVAPSVVQISVLRFRPGKTEEGSAVAGVVLSRQQVVGSGVIVDPDGYIVTNAHVVANALRIRVTRAVQLRPPRTNPDRASTTRWHRPWPRPSRRPWSACSRNSTWP